MGGVMINSFKSAMRDTEQKASGIPRRILNQLAAAGFSFAAIPAETLPVFRRSAPIPCRIQKRVRRVFIPLLFPFRR